MGGANFAPRPFSGVKIQSPDKNFNPNTTTNMIISSALQNALSGGNRPNFNFPALTAPTLPQQPLLTAPPQQPLLTAPPQQPQITAPPQQPQITAPIKYVDLDKVPNIDDIVDSHEAIPFHEAIANELIKDSQLINIYQTGKGKRGVKAIDKAYQEALSKLQGNILDKRLPFVFYPLRAMLGNKSIKVIYKPSLEIFKSIIDNLPPPPSAVTSPTSLVP